ncbi:hypothetical protein S245_044923, partial [Arachis hypogaea]
FGTQIPYESLNFGQLHNIIVQTKSVTGKKELGTFCYQYGITPEKAPSGQHKIKKKKFYKKSKYNIDKPLYYEEKYYKKFHKTPKGKPKSSNKKKQVTCWKCKKQGHYANKCTTEQKINKIENKEIKHALTAILINSESEEESIYEDSSETEDYFIQQLDLMTEEESSEGNSGKEEQNNCLGIRLCNCRNCEKTVNVLTREQTSTLVKIIDRLEDTPLRDDFIKQLAELVKKEEESKQEIRPTEIKEIYDRFKNPQEKVSLNSLKEEIKKLKREVSKLKQQNINMDYRLLKIEGENIIKIQEKTLQNNDKKPEEISNITIPENYINLGTKNYINVLTLLVRQKWFTTITLIVGEEKFDFIAMVDSGADVNCIQEGLIPTKYYEKTTERVLMAENDTMTIDYKLSKAKICKNRVCFATTFFLARNISHQVILGNPFTLLLYPFNVDIDGITCTRISNHPVHFEFLTRPKQHELNMLQHLSTQVRVIETETKQ